MSQYDKNLAQQERILMREEETLVGANRLVNRLHEEINRRRDKIRIMKLDELNSNRERESDGVKK